VVAETLETKCRMDGERRGIVAGVTGEAGNSHNAPPEINPMADLPAGQIRLRLIGVQQHKIRRMGLARRRGVGIVIGTAADKGGQKQKHPKTPHS